MAHPPPVFTPQKNVKHIEYIQDAQGEQRCHHDMFRTNMTKSQNNDTLDQQDVHVNNFHTEKKCQVYVHQFTKIPSRLNYMENNWRSGNHIHQAMYKHEFSDYYGAKMHALKKNFEHISLNSKPVPISNSPDKFPKHYSAHYKHPTERMDYNNRMTKIPHVKSSPTPRINKSFLFKPEHKAVADKLEESYWTKWKPNKVQTTNVNHKTKGLYTENEKINDSYQYEKNERGDSSETIAVDMSSTKREASNNNSSCVTYICSHSDTPISNLSEISLETENIISEMSNIEQKQTSSSQTNLSVSEEKNENEVTQVPIIVTKTDSESNVNILKHTDSFILTTAKQQNKQKPRYQQPKCIKLFKNLDYSTTGMTNHIKGGTYPLKSCLKKNNMEDNQSSPLGPPGGSPRINFKNRKPGKANRFT